MTMQSDDRGLVERAGFEATEIDMIRHGDMIGPTLGAKVLAAIERLLAERDEARRALRPFADLANDYMTDTVNIEDDVIIAGRTPRRGEEGTPPRVTFGDFRRAHLVDKIARARQALQDSAASGEQ